MSSGPGICEGNGAMQTHQLKVLPHLDKPWTLRRKAGDSSVGVVLPIAKNYTREDEKEMGGGQKT